VAAPCAAPRQNCPPVLGFHAGPEAVRLRAPTIVWLKEHMEERSIDREWKKGSAELLLLSLVETVPRHGYEIGKLIEQRSKARCAFTRRRSTRCCIAWRSAAGFKADGWRRAASAGGAITS
jgi:hypothetical protein